MRIIVQLLLGRLYFGQVKLYNWCGYHCNWYFLLIETKSYFGTRLRTSTRVNAKAALDVGLAELKQKACLVQTVYVRDDTNEMC